MKRIISLITSATMVFTLLTTGVFAESKSHKYNITNKDEAVNVIDLAKKGDKDAVETILSLKAFNKDEVKKVASKLKVNSAEKTKKVEFDDGSAIEITTIEFDKILHNDSDSARQLQAVYDYHVDCIAYQTIFGITTNKFITKCYWTGDTVENLVWNCRGVQNATALWPITVNCTGVTITSGGTGPWMQCWLDSEFNASFYGAAQVSVSVAPRLDSLGKAPFAATIN